MRENGYDFFLERPDDDDPEPPDHYSIRLTALVCIVLACLAFLAVLYVATGGWWR